MGLNKKIVKQIIPILTRHKIAKAAIFGSYARGEATKKSDLDLLIEFRGNKTLLDLVALQLDLQDVLKKDVDVVTYRSIDHRLKPYIMRDAIRIL